MLLAPDPVLLFRYSALSFNGHRIHYDLKFATEDEGYPGHKNKWGLGAENWSQWPNNAAEVRVVLRGGRGA